MCLPNRPVISSNSPARPTNIKIRCYLCPNYELVTLTMALKQDVWFLLKADNGNMVCDVSLFEAAPSYTIPVWQLLYACWHDHITSTTKQKALES